MIGAIVINCVTFSKVQLHNIIHGLSVSRFGKTNESQDLTHTGVSTNSHQTVRTAALCCIHLIAVILVHQLS